MTQHSIIDRWPSLSDFVADLGITYSAGKGMAHRERQGFVIPCPYWNRAIKAARSRKIAGVTLKSLADMAEARLIQRDEAA